MLNFSTDAIWPILNQLSITFIRRLENLRKNLARANTHHLYKEEGVRLFCRDLCILYLDPFPVHHWGCEGIQAATTGWKLLQTDEDVH